MNPNLALAFGTIFLLGTFFLTAVAAAIRVLCRRRSKEDMVMLIQDFFYFKVQGRFFRNDSLDRLILSLVVAQNVCRLSFMAGIIILASTQRVLPSQLIGPVALAGVNISWILSLLLFAIFVGLAVFVTDFFPRLLGQRNPEKTLHNFWPFASVYLFLSFPFIAIFLQIAGLWKIKSNRSQDEMVSVKDKILEIIEENVSGENLDDTDKKLIESAVSFPDRIVREIMVPRIDIFSLPKSTSIRKAAAALNEQGYSRTPVYRDTVDDIVGILMYRDLLEIFLEAESHKDPSLLDGPIESILKPVFYSPETKKISALLQEFRIKQTHMAIVVDEYGGTEGLITIEDVLEEIVGEIEDEYDEQEEDSITHLDDGWIVDARCSILDLEDETGVKIPHDGDYDTVGGYVSHRTGAVPARGLHIHHDKFEIEILEASDRCVLKVRITPIDPVGVSSEDDEHDPLT